MLKLGIIGCGRIVEYAHINALESLKDEVEVVSISDVSQERLKSVGKLLKLSEEHHYFDYRDMLEKENLDFADIAVPPFLHKEIVLDCARARINIILEKPIACTLEEVDMMLEMVEKKKVLLCVLHNYRYSPGVAKALELIKEKKIGTPFLIRSEVFSGGYWPGAEGYDPSWRTETDKSGGGCLIDNGYHNIYLSREMMQSPVKSVYAQIGTFIHNVEAEDTVLLLLRHENGGISSIQVGWSVKAQGARVNEVHGDKGSISFKPCIFFNKDDSPISLFINEKGQWEHPEVMDKHGNTIADLMDECLKAFREGKPVFTDGKEARRNLEIILAAYESARTGKVIEV